MLSLAFKILFPSLERIICLYLLLFIENLLGVLKPISYFLSLQVLDNVLENKDKVIIQNFYRIKPNRMKDLEIAEHKLPDFVKER